MRALKFTRLATAGQTIRGHDFPPALGGACSYVQGVVLETHCTERGCLDYKVRVTERMLGGLDQPEEVGAFGFIPHETAVLEWDARVELVQPEAA